ncbi:hypothetical protein PRZ48_013554 [Zasmidium cellare]|uniref:Uncharacterized protein n=1 Tax=Zasmidium cellare TaxID=395010 RepID=A0ABR0E1D2_ZASCE|nr:hypothetical protein PRZ48_013554 [Zasmidium cellare]
MSEEEPRAERRTPFLPTDEKGDIIFGPIMSPAIFARKWLSKFQQLLDQQDIQCRPDCPLLNPHMMYTMSVEGLGHVMVFKTDAYELDLQHSDFPSSRPLENHEPSIGKATFLAAERMHYMKNNPFEAAKLVTLLADSFVQRWKALKYGEKLLGKAWQEFPYICRQKLNDVFEIVEKGEKAGWWKVSDQFRKSSREGLQDWENWTLAFAGI